MTIMGASADKAWSVPPCSFCGSDILEPDCPEIVAIPFLLQLSGQTSLYIQHKDPSFRFMAFMNLTIVWCESKLFSFASWPLVFSGALAENVAVGALGPSWWSRPPHSRLRM